MRRSVKYIIFAVIVSVFIFIDQLTKYFAQETLTRKPAVLIEGVLELTFLKNTGAAWGAFSGAQVFFISVTAALMAFMVYVLIKLPSSKHFMLMLFAIVFLFAGAAGNFIDRIAYSYVRDFIYFKIINFPVFNVADICVTVGAVLLICGLLFVYRDNDYRMIFKKSHNNKQG